MTCSTCAVSSTWIARPSRARTIWTDPRVTMTVKEAVEELGGRYSERTIRMWAEEHLLGERIRGAGSSPWTLCRPLLLAYVNDEDGKREVLRYRTSGEAGPGIRAQFERLGVSDLL